MTFAQPIWLGVGLIVCLATFLLFRKLEADRRRRLEKFAAPRLLGRYTAALSPTKRSLKRYLIITTVFLCFVAIARPQYSYKWVDVKRKGIDIMFAIDTSKSMLTRDMKPSRLERAKFAILDFVQKLDGDRVGLLPFAGNTYLLCPLTLDYDAFSQSVNAISTTIIPSGGTNISDTIRDADKILSESTNHKILILLSDGENLEGDVLKAAEDVAEKEMTIFTVGVGTAGGELIPVQQNGKTRFIKDQKGNFVTSKLDENKLRKIAEITNGTYVRLSADGSGLETIYQKKLSLLPKEEIAERKQKVPIERYEWPLGAAVVLLLIEFMLSSRNGSAPDYLNRIKTAGRRLKRTTIPSFLLLIPLLLLQSPLSVEASPGEDAFAQENYIKASKYYTEKLEKQPGNARLLYNLGTSQYKNNLYDQAIETFGKALNSDDPELQKKAYYNRGNSYYQKGKMSLQVDPQLTVEHWQKSVDDFEACLALDQNAEDAQFNLDIVKKQLEQLKQQQQEQQSNNKNEQGDQKQNSQQQQKQNKDQPENSEQNKDRNNDNGSTSDKQQNNTQNSDQTDEKRKQPDIAQQKQGQTESKEHDTITTANADKTSADDQKHDQQEQRAQIVKKEGEMSEKEAKQLLQSLMAEEGQLNFIPQRQNSKTIRDW